MKVMASLIMNLLEKIFLLDDVITDSKTSDLIYLNGDRFIIVELDDYKNSEQLSYDDSK